MVHLFKIAIIIVVIVSLVLLLTACTTIQYQNAEGAKISIWSFLSDKRFSGNLVTEGNKRTLIVNEFDENQTEGAAKIAGAVVEAAVKELKP